MKHPHLISHNSKYVMLRAEWVHEAQEKCNYIDTKLFPLNFILDLQPEENSSYFECILLLYSKSFLAKWKQNTNQQAKIRKYKIQISSTRAATASTIKYCALNTYSFRIFRHLFTRLSWHFLNNTIYSLPKEKTISNLFWLRKKFSTSTKKIFGPLPEEGWEKKWLFRTRINNKIEFWKANFFGFVFFFFLFVYTCRTKIARQWWLR